MLGQLIMLYMKIKICLLLLVFILLLSIIVYSWVCTSWQNLWETVRLSWGPTIAYRLFSFATLGLISAAVSASATRIFHRQKRSWHRWKIHDDYSSVCIPSYPPPAFLNAATYPLLSTELLPPLASSFLPCNTHPSSSSSSQVGLQTNWFPGFSIFHQHFHFPNVPVHFQYHTTPLFFFLRFLFCVVSAVKILLLSSQ